MFNQSKFLSLPVAAPSDAPLLTAIDETRRLCNLGDLEAAINLLHGLSGVASFLQTRELARLAIATEEAMRDGHTDELPVMFDALQAALLTVKESLHQFEVFYAKTPGFDMPS